MKTRSKRPRKVTRMGRKSTIVSKMSSNRDAAISNSGPLEAIYQGITTGLGSRRKDRTRDTSTNCAVMEMPTRRVLIRELI